MRHWGERSIGTWTLTVRDLVTGDISELVDWELTAYGTGEAPGPLPPGWTEEERIFFGGTPEDQVGGNSTLSLVEIGDQTVSPNDVSMKINLVSIDADGDDLTYTAVIGNTADNTAYELDQQHDFWLPAEAAQNDYWFNYRGEQERYLNGFFILPGGELYRWGGNIENSTYVATLDARYHADPSLLVDVMLPDVPTATVSFEGNTLTITPPPDFVGSFEVTVTVSDGNSSDSETFVVNIVESAFPTVFTATKEEDSSKDSGSSTEAAKQSALNSDDTDSLDTVFADLNVMDL